MAGDGREQEGRETWIFFGNGLLDIGGYVFKEGMYLGYGFRIWVWVLGFGSGRYGLWVFGMEGLGWL